MNKVPRAKKPVPLTGDFLSTGVSLEKASPTQLNMESGRLIKVAVLRTAATKDQLTNIEDDEQYRAALDRSKMINKLCLQRMKEVADSHGIEMDFPVEPD